MEPLEARQLLSVSLQPLSNVVVPQGSASESVDLNQLFTDNLTGAADLAFSAKSDNTALAQATLSGSTLTLSFAATASGFAHVSFTATAPDGSIASQAIRIQVTASSDRTLTVPLGGTGHNTFRFVGSNHAVGQITLLGPGSGTITMGGDGLSVVGTQARGANQEIESIALTGTTSASQLVIGGIAANRGRAFADVGNITSDGSLGSIQIKKVVLVGDVTLAGGVSSINIEGALSTSLSFGKNDGAIALQVGTFEDVGLSTPAPFGLIRVNNWFSTDSVPETFQAAYVSRIFSTGNFDVGLSLTGTGAPARSIGKITVNGLIGGTWNIPGSSAPLLIGGTTSDWRATFTNLPYINDLGSMGGSLTIPTLPSLKVHGNMIGALLNFTGATGTDLSFMHVYGVIRSSVIESSANLGPIVAEALEGTLIYAGVAPLQSGQVLPASAAELSSSATIESISLRPRGKITLGYVNSDIAASAVGNLSLGTTDVANSGITFGVAAESIGHLFLHDMTNHRVLTLNNVHDAATLAAQIAAAKFTLQDLSLAILS